MQDFIQCLVCSVQFPNRELCVEHFQSYQSQITSLLAKGQELAIQVFGPDLSAEFATLLSRVEALVLHHDPYSNTTVGFKAEPKAKLRCPHHDCDDAEQTFSRPQDLERHYASHYEQPVECLFCREKIPPKKYISHACGSASASQIAKQRRTWRKTLRDDIRKVQLLKCDGTKKPNDPTDLSSRERELPSSNDYPQCDITTALTESILEAAETAGSASNAGLSRSQDPPHRSAVAASQNAIVNGLPSSHLPIYAPINSSNQPEEIQQEQASVHRPIDAPIYLESFPAAIWQEQAPLGLNELANAPIYSMTSFAQPSSMCRRGFDAQLPWNPRAPSEPS